MPLYDFQTIAATKAFLHHFGRRPIWTSRAPGRLEILGNHTDYNEGVVLSAAINFGTFFAVAKRDDATVRLTAGDIDETVEFPVSAPEASATSTWSNYVRGVVAGLNAVRPLTCGADAMLLGNIPLGAGLSSSAALEMCACLAFAELAGITLGKVEMAKIGQAAEHKYAGVKCGLLDQLSSVCGVEGCLVWSDFRSLEVETVGISPDTCFLLCNTHAKHALVDGAYNERREACERGAAYFASVLPHKVTALRDVTLAELEAHRAGLDDVTARRCAHPIGEDERVLAGVDLLRKGDVEGFGALMFASHDSSRHNFENSCPELDTLVDTAHNIPGVLGARLSGGGFGGSVIALVRTRDVEAAAAAFRNAYEKTYGVPCDTRVIQCSAGATLV